jgi:FkbM family methyltransferase
VILDDSTDETHFAHLKRMFRDEPRVRLYNRSRNSGSIGNVKNEAVSLCRGKYVLELDHDDVILPNLVKDAVDAFQKYPEVGFVYMDCCNMHEDGRQFSWGDFCCLGYGAYYYQKHDGIWMSVMCTPQINNMTMSHLVAMPNHPRIWKRDLLNQIGNYSEMLPICDDLEVLLRTCYNTKMLKIPKLAYIQIFNDGGNNFSWIRNAEINRLGPQYIAPMSAKQNNSDEFFKSIGAWDEKTPQRIQLWKRDVAPPYANILYHPDYDTQIGIIGMKAFEMNMERIKELYADTRNDFILLMSKGVKEEIIARIEKEGLDRMKFYILADADDETLVKYFHWVYRGVDGAIIFDDKHASKAANTALTLKDSRGQVFNHLLVELPEQELAEQHITADCVVLELGARYGSVSCIINRKLANPGNQVSVEPAADIWDALEKNRDENGCSFHILKGAISKEPLKLVQSGYATRSVSASGATSTTEVPIYTLDEVEAKYGLKFNTLVADCEGFLGKFLDENPRVYEDFTLFMFEKDFPQFCNYDKIIQKLRDHGFVNLFSSLHEVWRKGSTEPKGSVEPLPKI